MTARRFELGDRVAWLGYAATVSYADGFRVTIKFDDASRPPLTMGLAFAREVLERLAPELPGIGAAALRSPRGPEGDGP